MKKLLFVFLFIFSSFFSFSQTWINPGATWNYRFVYMAGMVGYEKIQYTHDTLMYGKNCQVLHTTRETWGPMGPGAPPSYWSTEALPDRYTYNNGNTVFYLVDTNMGASDHGFHILYNFAAGAGDNWDLGIDSSIFCGPHSLVIADSTRLMTIGTTTHKVVYTHDSDTATVGLEPCNDWYYLDNKGILIENIGNLYYLFPKARNCKPFGYVDQFELELTCFTDGITDLVLVPSGECENPFHLGIDAIFSDDNDLVLYPNPASEELTISWQNKDTYIISVYNVLGELLLQKNAASALSETLNISELNSGVY